MISIKVLLPPPFPRNFVATERGSFLLQEFQSGREISRERERGAHINFKNLFKVAFKFFCTCDLTRYIIIVHYMKGCKFVKYILKYRRYKNSNQIWPFWKLFGLIVKERERQGRLLCRRVVVVRGCRLWHIGEDSFFQMLGDGGTN